MALCLSSILCLSALSLNTIMCPLSFAEKLLFGVLKQYKYSGNIASEDPVNFENDDSLLQPSRPV